MELAAGGDTPVEKHLLLRKRKRLSRARQVERWLSLGVLASNLRRVSKQG